MNPRIIEVFAESPADQVLALKFSQEFKIPLAPADLDKIQAPLLLVISDGKVGFKLIREPKAPVYFPEFSSATTQFKIEDELKRRGKLLKAIEGKFSTKPSLRVFDAFGGFAQDGFLLACAGHDVLNMEKNPLVHLVTKAAWDSQNEEAWILEKNVNLSLSEGDSFEFLSGTQEFFDVIYWDPMFEKLKSKSKSALPMQILQSLLNQKESAPLDFDWALRLSLQRAPKVVMKLPIKGPPLVKKSPSHQIPGKTIRYDVFI
ncbi:class I SAM-dependent methyltransferase [bacterium]|nr:class I SAM-dependent methyltransferase [bacterium]